MNDISSRVLKTFVQAFFGVLIPELCVILNGVPLDFAPAAFVPMLCASVAAGLSAAWNLLEKYLSGKKDDTSDFFF